MGSRFKSEGKRYIQRQRGEMADTGILNILALRSVQVRVLSLALEIAAWRSCAAGTTTNHLWKSYSAAIVSSLEELAES